MSAARATKEQIRALLMQEAPDMLHFIDDMRKAFPGCRLAYLKVGDVEIGKRQAFDSTEEAESAAT